MEDQPAARFRGPGRRARGSDLAELLAARPEARLLDAGADTLALMLPRFGGAVASTPGGVAHHRVRGAYARPGLAGGRLAATPGLIGLRLAPGRGERIVCLPAGRDGGRAALCLFDAGGRLVHLARIAGRADPARLAAFLDGIPEALPPMPAPAPAAGVASLAAIRQTREGWDRAEAAAHVDGLMLDGGRTRRSALPRLGPEARRIDPRVIGPLLAHLARARRRFRAITARPGCLVIDEGAMEGCRQLGERALLRFPRGLLALRLDRVASAWVTRIGQGREMSRALELYDAEGFAAAAFLAPSEPDPRRNAGWESLLASLPVAPPAEAAPLRPPLVPRRSGPFPRLVTGTER